MTIRQRPSSRQGSVSTVVCHVSLCFKELDELHRAHLSVCSAVFRIVQPCCADGEPDQLSRRLVMLRDHSNGYLTSCVFIRAHQLHWRVAASSVEPKYCKVDDMESGLSYQR